MTRQHLRRELFLTADYAISRVLGGRMYRKHRRQVARAYASAAFRENGASARYQKYRLNEDLLKYVIRAKDEMLAPQTEPPHVDQ